MTTSSKIIAIIPARGGSKGVSRKNIRLLGKKPLIVYTIETALASKYIERVIVTTDDEEVARIARKYGAEVPFLRPEELAQDDTPPYPVLKHALKFLKEEEGLKPDIIVWLEPPTPFRTVKEVDEAIQIFQKDTDADSLRAVCTPSQNPFKMWTLEGKYLKPLIQQDGQVFHSGPRQKTKQVFWQNGSIFLLRYDTIIKKGNFFGDKILPLIVENSSNIEIDTEEDFKQAEYYLKNIE
jgi:N-acylneuraminate cytidylyltransferase